MLKPYHTKRLLPFVVLSYLSAIRETTKGNRDRYGNTTVVLSFISLLVLNGLDLEGKLRFTCDKSNLVPQNRTALIRLKYLYEIKRGVPNNGAQYIVTEKGKKVYYSIQAKAYKHLLAYTSDSVHSITLQQFESLGAELLK